MKWGDFKVGQRLGCTKQNKDFLAVVERVLDRRIRLRILDKGGNHSLPEITYVSYPALWFIKKEFTPKDKFSHHMKRVEERHLKRAKK